MNEQPVETEIEERRRQTLLRVRKHREKKAAKQKAAEQAVDSPIEITNKEARRILQEERGFRPIPGSNPLHAVHTAVHLLRTAAENLGIPFNYYWVRRGVQQTVLQLIPPELSQIMLRPFIKGLSKAEVRQLLQGPSEDLEKELETCKELTPDQAKEAEIILQGLALGAEPQDVQREQGGESNG